MNSTTYKASDTEHLYILNFYSFKWREIKDVAKCSKNHEKEYDDFFNHRITSISNSINNGSNDYNVYYSSTNKSITSSFTNPGSNSSVSSDNVCCNNKDVSGDDSDCNDEKNNNHTSNDDSVSNDKNLNIITDFLVINQDLVQMINQFTKEGNFDLEVLKQFFLKVCKKLNILGTIILAKEGINGGIVGSKKNIDFIFKIINILFDVNFKFTKIYTTPFSKLKIKIKKEISAFGYEIGSVEDHKGEYISGQNWNEIFLNKNNIIIDVRNDYEYNQGNFYGAINPKTKYFREFPKWIDDNIEQLLNKKVFMYCTGGIRCEKATAYLKLKYNHNNVYHLKGGILDYMESKNRSNWQGKCFVFDDRVSV